MRGFCSDDVGSGEQCSVHGEPGMLSYRLQDCKHICFNKTSKKSLLEPLHTLLNGLQPQHPEGWMGRGAQEASCYQHDDDVVSALWIEQLVSMGITVGDVVSIYVCIR